MYQLNNLYKVTQLNQLFKGLFKGYEKSVLQRLYLCFVLKLFNIKLMLTTIKGDKICLKKKKR